MPLIVLQWINWGSVEVFVNVTLTHTGLLGAEVGLPASRGRCRTTEPFGLPVEVPCASLMCIPRQMVQKRCGIILTDVVSSVGAVSPRTMFIGCTGCFDARRLTPRSGRSSTIYYGRWVGKVLAKGPKFISVYIVIFRGPRTSIRPAVILSTSLCKFVMPVSGCCL